MDENTVAAIVVYFFIFIFVIARCTKDSKSNHELKTKFNKRKKRDEFHDRFVIQRYGKRR